MIAEILLGLGFVFIIEGLVFALAPSRMEDLIAVISKLAPDARRMLGLVAMCIGVCLVWVVKSGALFG